MKSLTRKSFLLGVLSFIIIGALMVCAMFMLTACGNDNTNTNNKDNVVDPKVSVDVITAGGQKTILDDGTIVVVYDNVTLQWSPKDESVSRNSDGWWAGIKVTAPTQGFDLDKAVYSSKNDLSNPQSFKTNRDGDYYIGLWGLANEDFMTRPAFVERGYFDYNRYYDWNGDGTADAHVILRIKTNCTLAPVEQ